MRWEINNVKETIRNNELELKFRGYWVERARNGPGRSIILITT